MLLLSLFLFIYFISTTSFIIPFYFLSLYIYKILSLCFSLTSSVKVQTGPGVHSASYKMSTEVFPGCKSGRA